MEFASSGEQALVEFLGGHTSGQATPVVEPALAGVEFQPQIGKGLSITLALLPIKIRNSLASLSHSIFLKQGKGIELREVRHPAHAEGGEVPQHFDVRLSSVWLAFLPARPF